MDEIRVYDLVSVPDMQRLLPVIREGLFGMRTERDGADKSCSMNERGYVLFSDRKRLFATRKAVATLPDSDVLKLGSLFIEKSNKLVADHLIVGPKLRLQEYIQTPYLKRGVVTKALNPLTGAFGHYVVTYDCLVRPSASAPVHFPQKVVRS